MFTILDYSSALEYSIIRRYTNIVLYVLYVVFERHLLIHSGRVLKQCYLHNNMGDE